MRKILLGLLFILPGITLFAETSEEKKEKEKKDKEEVKPWVLKGVSGLNFTQTSLSNWSSGGESSLSGNAYLNGSLVHKSGSWLWENDLILEYGLTHTKSSSTKKSNDKIDYSTKLGYSTDNKWFYTGMLDFKSQFYKGHQYEDKKKHISRFMAPGYLNLSAGIEYRPNDNYSIYFSPVAGKFTFVLDKYLSDLGSFGVDKGQRVRPEFGTYLKAKAEKKLMENITLITKVDFFTAYNQTFGNIDVDWDLLINMKINKFFSANINTTLKYDDDITHYDKHGNPHGARVQFKETFGIGLAYHFNSK